MKRVMLAAVIALPTAAVAEHRVSEADVIREEAMRAALMGESAIERGALSLDLDAAREDAMRAALTGEREIDRMQATSPGWTSPIVAGVARVMKDRRAEVASVKQDGVEAMGDAMAAVMGDHGPILSASLNRTAPITLAPFDDFQNFAAVTPAAPSVTTPPSFAEAPRMIEPRSMLGLDNAIEIFAALGADLDDAPSISISIALDTPPNAAPAAIETASIRPTYDPERVADWEFLGVEIPETLETNSIQAPLSIKHMVPTFDGVIGSDL